MVVKTCEKTGRLPASRNWNNLKMNVSEKVKVLSIEPVVLQQLGVVHVVWKVGRHREITETHDLFGGVGHQRAIDAGSLWLR